MELKVLSQNEINVAIKDEIASLLRRKPNAVLGLATGSSPIGVYDELIKAHKAGDISFNEVTSFNLDEYIGLDSNHPQSYRYFI